MIQYENVSKTFPGGTHAVKNLSFTVEEGETVVLLGTSGSGKTTTLKMTNRLIEPSGGRILVEDTDILRQNPIKLRRRIGYAIQSIGLFPHMTVTENVGLVPRLLKWDATKINDRVEELLSMVDLEPKQFMARYPSQLSGGQQQRVGVARALAADPPIILMDEPFGAIDPMTREQLQNEFLSLQDRINKTVLFVTHDIFEAFKMGDRIALFDKGELLQIATPRELVDSPANSTVESFLSQHIFQLTLTTRRIGSLPCSEKTPDTQFSPEQRLKARDSFLDALDTFNQHKQDVLPVYKSGERIGFISKSQLTRAIAETLSDQ